ncbi:succinate dehydrogenase cytochrome b subunit [Arthrobacter sp. VKM Ac-2550]|uniref:succinate dehydrogenase cytochrome b subunit n=1 Tax=Crystallibacter permensis TaxID=1938888 RepID=UPI0022277430|nr:succinate dehydrogenase cytochrome b subunit [Arthrobacter sp. VKM Ac-2550]MCW2133193.1 succinate dehydrogenase subunit C [Arthrobacter sp. VKM Ac-2550]
MTVKTTAGRYGRALRSSVVLHAVMAVGGLIMALYLVAHMYGNLKIFSGQAAFDGYSSYLRTIGEPLLPYSGALWILRVVLLVSVGAHIYAAFVLWHRARAATGGKGGWRYQTTRNRRGVQRSYASFTMRWGGIVILLFVIYHLLHLTANVIAPGGASESPYERMINGFSIWWVVLSYVIALIALGFHLRHGVWSAFASLGANTSVVRRRRLNQLAYAVTIVIIGGFLIPPVSILMGWVR